MENDFIKQLREGLHPNGTAPVIRLFLQESGANYFKEDFVHSCIDELEKRMMCVLAGLDSLSPLEKLAVHVLTDSAYITNN